MTIKEKFAKYSTEEIIAGIQNLKVKIQESDDRLENYKSIGDYEFYKAEKDLNEDLFQKLMDAEAALAGRK